MYLVVHFIWVQLQHMKYNGQSYFVFIYYYNHFLGKKIVNLYLYVIRRNIGFVYTFQKIIVVVFQLCVFKMQSLHGRLLSKVLAHLLSVFCSTTVKVHKFKSKKKMDNPLCWLSRLLYYSVLRNVAEWLSNQWELSFLLGGIFG